MSGRPLYIIFFIASLIVGWVLATGNSKTDFVRLIDIFIYGPFLLYLAYKGIGDLKGTSQMNSAEVALLVFIGATTISYNARNYMKI